MKWLSQQNIGSVNDLHSYTCDKSQLLAILNRPTSDSIVLGSSQSMTLLDSEKIKKTQIEICKRKTGGGLVYIDKVHDIWIDIYIPTTSSLYEINISKSFNWLGNTWIETLTELNRQLEPNLQIVKTKSKTDELSSLVCFAGLNHGEVLYCDRKVVGISQRRNKELAKFQCQLTYNDPYFPLLNYIEDTTKIKNVRPQKTLNELKFDGETVFNTFLQKLSAL